MGHNPTKNPFRRARLGLDVGTQAAVDEYKARSVWSVWWQLDEAVRRRYFTRDERTFITRYGARLDEIACHVAVPRNDAERHFLQVCMGECEPQTDRAGLWLHVHLVCRYERAMSRAGRADLAEHRAIALQAENRALQAKSDHLEAYVLRLASELSAATGERNPGMCNVVYASMRVVRKK